MINEAKRKNWQGFTTRNKIKARSAASALLAQETKQGYK
jgi:hypothetical protein